MVDFLALFVGAGLLTPAAASVGLGVKEEKSDVSPREGAGATGAPPMLGLTRVGPAGVRGPSVTVGSLSGITAWAGLELSTRA